MTKMKTNICSDCGKKYELPDFITVDQYTVCPSCFARGQKQRKRKIKEYSRSRKSKHANKRKIPK